VIPPEIRGKSLYAGLYNRSIVKTMYANLTTERIWNKWVLICETVGIRLLVGG
jgi:hypothetical protein